MFIIIIGWRRIAVVGAGASVAAVLALLAYFSFSGKCRFYFEDVVGLEVS